MSFLRVTYLFLLVVFFVEVINPSTSFVRVQVSPVCAQKNSKVIKKATQSIQAPIESSDHNNQNDDDDDDYVASSAIVLNIDFSPKTYLQDVLTTFKPLLPLEPSLARINRPPTQLV